MSFLRSIRLFNANYEPDMGTTLALAGVGGQVPAIVDSMFQPKAGDQPLVEVRDTILSRLGLPLPGVRGERDFEATKQLAIQVAHVIEADPTLTAELWAAESAARAGRREDESLIDRLAPILVPLAIAIPVAGKAISVARTAEGIVQAQRATNDAELEAELAAIDRQTDLAAEGPTSLAPILILGGGVAVAVVLGVLL